eukprot:4606000-Prymnesium_polylepis.1
MCPVAGVAGEVVRLCCAVEEVVGEVLHDAHRLGAGHRLCSAPQHTQYKCILAYMRPVGLRECLRAGVHVREGHVSC